MAFDADTWRTAALARLNLTPGSDADGLPTAAAACLWPVVEAMKSGNLGAISVLQSADREGRCAGILGRVGGWDDVAAAARDLGDALSSDHALAAEISSVFRFLGVDRAVDFAANIGSGATAHGAGAMAAGAGAAILKDSPITVNLTADPELRKAAEAERRYLLRLRNKFNVIPLAALTGSEDTRLEVSLERVYVEQFTLTPADGDGGQAKSAARGEQRYLTVLEAVTASRRAVLLGDPGGGKSTFVRQLAAWLASARLREKDPPSGWDDRPLPLLLEMRDAAAALTALSLDGIPAEQKRQLLVDAIRRRWREQLVEFEAEEMAPRMNDALDQGSAMLIFDGLDEVPLASRARVRDAMCALAEAYPNVQRLIITCRSRSYGEGSATAGFEAHTLAPFDNEMIARFVTAWYEAQHRLNRFTREKAAERILDLRRAARSGAMQELATSPMLLTTMAIVHQQETTLPDERVQLYQKVVEILQYRWQEHKNPSMPVSQLDAVLTNRSRMRDLLQRLAYFAHEREARGASDKAVPREKLLTLLEGSDVLGGAGLASEFLDYVDQRAAVIVGEGGGDSKERPQSYAFPHRTIQEFLAGCQMVAGREMGREFLRRAGEGEFWHVAAQMGAEHLLHNGTGNPAPLLDLAYYLCPVAEPAHDAAWRALLWSGHMAATVGPDVVRSDRASSDGGENYLTRLKDRLLRSMRGTLPPAMRIEAGRVLARVGDPRPEVLDPLRIEFCKVPVGPFLMGSGADDAEADDGEQPQHEYHIPYKYEISRHPVTQAQFAAFVKGGGYHEARFWGEAERDGVWRDGRVRDYGDEEEWRAAPYDFGEPYRLSNHPVVGVTWYEALAFTRWLSERRVEAGHSPVRLPSEPEWEKAARGNDGRIYPWGNQLDSNRSHTHEAGVLTTSAVGCFPGGGSPYHAEDMAGNVWEWTRSRYDRYPCPVGEDVTAREVLAARVIGWRVLRGGSCFLSRAYARCAARDRGHPLFHFCSVGFRVVLSPSATLD